jgi:polyphosphate glucokinase
MVSGVKKLAADWTYDAVSIGYPGPVLAGRPIAEPANLGGGWVGFNFARAFGRPVKLVNDAAMQALGSYKGGKMLFLGLGTGLGTAMIVEGVVAQWRPAICRTKGDLRAPRWAHLERNGKKKWRRHVADVAERLIAALQPDDTVIGIMQKLKTRCRIVAKAQTQRLPRRVSLWSKTVSFPGHACLRAPGEKALSER